MNPKLIPAIINAVISFIVIVPLSFLMNKFINHSEDGFMKFFEEKWPIFLTFVVIFTVYNLFLKGRKFK